MPLARTMHVSIRNVRFLASGLAAALTVNVSSWHYFPVRCGAAIQFAF